jgi:hypothetical protein
LVLSLGFEKYIADDMTPGVSLHGQSATHQFHDGVTTLEWAKALPVGNIYEHIGIFRETTFKAINIVHIEVIRRTV